MPLQGATTIICLQQGAKAGVKAYTSINDETAQHVNFTEVNEPEAQRETAASASAIGKCTDSPVPFAALRCMQL